MNSRYDNLDADEIAYWHEPALAPDPAVTRLLTKALLLFGYMLATATMAMGAILAAALIAYVFQL